MPGIGPALRVMSFNVLNAHSGHHAGRWSLRRQPVAMAIWAFGPDLLGAQELQRTQADYLRSQLPEYEFISPGQDEGVLAGESVAIFFRIGRFDMVEQGYFWLSRRPDEPGSRNWGAVAPRMCVWARLLDLRDPRHREVVIFSTHFDALSRWARFRSAEVLRDRIASIAGRAAVVVCGDFNANAHRKLYEAVLAGRGGDELRLVDAYRLAHPTRERNEGTWHGRGIRFWRRMDWVLHTPNFEVLDAGIDQSRRNGRYPSDHFPVTATLQWKRMS